MKSIRLTVDLRNTIVIKMKDKIYPPTKLKELENKVALSFKSLEKIKEKIDLYEKYPEYIFSTSSLTIKDDIKTNSTLCVITPYTFAVKIREKWDSSLIRLSEEGVTDEQRQAFWDLIQFREDRKKFDEEVRNLINSVNTTAQLLQVLPEAEEFLPHSFEESPIVDQTNVNFVRSCLSTAPKSPSTASEG